jgi:1,4-dihydroxy-2-naphthoate octaprenyltransferase
VLAVTLVAALLIQIGTNLANDLSDALRGADTDQRLGPRRVTQSGLATPGQVGTAVLVVFAAAAILGLALVVVGGWPIAAVGAASILAGLAYTGGPWPYGYRALGEVFVFVFFGIIAVTGTAYLQLDRLPPASWLAALPVASTVTAILVVNNLRDLPTDRASGKRTLAVILGEGGTRLEYAILMLAPFPTVTGLALAGALPLSTLLVWLAAPAAAVLVSRVTRGPGGSELNCTLAHTGQVHLLLGGLLAVALAL